MKIIMNKIIAFNKIKDFTKQLHQQGKTIVLAGGCFDFLHIGHINFLENAKKQADTLIVLLESDESIKKQKGIDRPLHNQNQRSQILSAIKYVDFVVLLPHQMNDKKYDELIVNINPSVIAATEGDTNIVHKNRQAKLTSAKVVFVNKKIKGISTTQLLKIIAKEI